MTEQDKVSPGLLTKISRNGERFWLRNCRPMNGKLYGQVDNNLLANPYKQGDVISFEREEIIDWIDERQT